MNLDEDALLCDFAETYHVYDIETLPLSRAASFAVGLRENSRIKLKAAGLNYDFTTLLLSAMTDGINTLIWMQTEDGHKGRNRPKSIYAQLVGLDEQEGSDLTTFASGADFDRAWKELLWEGGENFE